MVIYNNSADQTLSEIESKPVFLPSNFLLGFENPTLTFNENASNLVIVNEANFFSQPEEKREKLEKIVEIFRKNLSSKLILRYDWSQLLSIEPIAVLISNFITYYNLHNDHDRIGFLGQDPIEMNILDKMLKKMGHDIHIDVYGEYILLNTPIYDLTTIQPNKKFSCFSRSHRKERLDFFSELIEKDLLKYFIYSYKNNYVYDRTTDDLYQNKEFLKSQVDKIFDPVREKIDNWIDGMPYGFSDNDELLILRHKFLFENLAKSFFHIVLETEQHSRPPEQIDGECIISAMVTEKTYKAISCRRPFIIFSNPYALEYLKLRGYKTFHPYIREDYDHIEDMVERRKAIIQEILRLSNLGFNDFLETYNNCKDICEHNYRLFIEHSKVKTGTWFQKLGINIQYPHYWSSLSVEDKEYALKMLDG